MIGWLIGWVVWFLDAVRGIVATTLGEPAGKGVDLVTRYVSGQHKIQRLSASLKGLHKMKAIESCLHKSRSSELQRFGEFTEVDELQFVILSEKQIDGSKDPEFVARFSTTFHPLCEINKIAKEAVNLKKTPYDKEDEGHEMTLLDVWSCLQGEIPLDNRISGMWGDIGFQGEDPATDFRGMGILGLQNLHYLAKHKKSGARLFSASNHPQYGFSLAITSINLTAVMMQMLESGLLRYHFYYKCSHGGSRTLTITDLHEAFCSILSDFVEFYQERKPSTIMEFNLHKAAYTQILTEKLMSDLPLLEPVE